MSGCWLLPLSWMLRPRLRAQRPQRQLAATTMAQTQTMRAAAVVGVLLPSMLLSKQPGARPRVLSTPVLL
jgi:hypothetical protein